MGLDKVVKRSRKTKAWACGGILLLLLLMSAVTIYRTKGVFVLTNTQNKTRATTPTCEKLMQSSKLYANGSFLTSKQTRIEWKLRPDDSRELTLPDVCHLKRYTAAQAGQCLKNKNLLFIGDSLTRYQFTSLSYFLDHKHWPKRFHASLQPCTHISEDGTPACNIQDEPSVCTNIDWKQHWAGYYQSMGGGIDGDVFHGRMESLSARFGDEFDTIMDIMRYTSSEEYGIGPSRTQLTFIMEAGTRGDEPFRGFNFNGCGYNATCRNTPRQYNRLEERLRLKQFDWMYPNITTALEVSGNEFHDQNPYVDYVFYNRGIWGKLQSEKAVQMLNAMSRMSSRCFYKTTTSSPAIQGRNLTSHEDGPVRKAATNAGCDFYDVGHVTEEFGHIMRESPDYASVFWDGFHYVPWVYEELNNLLLNILCNNQVLVLD
jgi:hypothetical protein